MRKYLGKEPNAIASVSGQLAPHKILATTNNGGKYIISDDQFPRIGRDVFDYKFERCHTQLFEQDVNAFHRVLEGYRFPFAVYVKHLGAPVWLHEFERWARKAFIEDMAKQNIIVKFTA